MGGLAAGTSGADIGVGVCVHGGLLEVPLQDRRSAAGPRIAGEKGCVEPLSGSTRKDRVAPGWEWTVSSTQQSLLQESSEKVWHVK